MVNTHVGGAPVRMLLDGVPRPLGSTMMKRRAWFERHADNVRRATILEPRGSTDVVGVFLTEPTSESADAGLLFLDAGGYPVLNGAAVVAAVTIALERGLVTKAGQLDLLGGGEVVRLDFDTPAGLVVAQAQVSRQEGVTRVRSVRVTGVPSFVAQAGGSVAVGSRRLRVDIAFGGAFFAIVDSEAVGIPLTVKWLSELRRLGVEICAALDDTEGLTHPSEPGRRPLGGAIFTGPAEASDAHLRTVTIVPHGGCERSPSISSTSAVMAVLDAMGLLLDGSEFVHEGLLGVCERGRVLRHTRVGDYPAVVPEVTGCAWVTGDQTLVVDSADPLHEGFRV